MRADSGGGPESGRNVIRGRAGDGDVADDVKHGAIRKAKGVINVPLPGHLVLVHPDRDRNVQRRVPATLEVRPVVGAGVPDQVVVAVVRHGRRKLVGEPGPG